MYTYLWRYESASVSDISYRRAIYCENRYRHSSIWLNLKRNFVVFDIMLWQCCFVCGAMVCRAHNVFNVRSRARARDDCEKSEFDWFNIDVDLAILPVLLLHKILNRTLPMFVYILLFIYLLRFVAQFARFTGKDKGGKATTVKPGHVIYVLSGIKIVTHTHTHIHRPVHSLHSLKLAASTTRRALKKISINK